MADNTPNIPGGAVPPRPSEAPKVQPRKETVRINLPPKPTAGASSATIKLPTLPAASAPAPFTPAAAPPPPSAAVPPAAAAPKPPAPPAAPGARVAAPPSRPAAAVPPPPGAPVKRAPVAVAAKSVGGLDKGLAIFAAVASVAALGSVVYLGWFLSTHPAG